MSVERWLRLIAGVFVVATVALGVWVNHWWLAFTAFIGLNLFQSAFTDWCRWSGCSRSSARNAQHRWPETTSTDWLPEGNERGYT